MAKQWIKEMEAAEMLGYRSPRQFRRHVQKGKFFIAYTHVNGRKFQYNERDILKMLEQNSTLMTA